MLRKSLLLWPAAVVASALGFQACNPAGANYAKTKSGIEYKIFDKTGKAKDIKPEEAAAAYKKNEGQIIALHVEYHTAKDSVLFQSRKQRLGYPMRIPLQAVTTKGGLEEALSLLQAGDSGVFRFNVDSVFAKSFHQPVPPQLKKHGNTLNVLVKVAAIQSPAEAQTADETDRKGAMEKMQQHEAKQKGIDEKIIQDYAQKNNLQTQQTPSGVHYVVTQPGTGPKPKAGQTVSVQYRGTLLDGKEFDSSAKSNGGQPIDFPIGVQQVIRGWDEAIPMLNKGSKAILLIPSSLAYGMAGAGANIPADAVLRFDVELVDVKETPAPPMGMMPGGGAPQGAPQGR